MKESNMKEDLNKYFYVKTKISKLTTEISDIDICELYPDIHGIGYNELRYIGINDGQLTFESNNVHDWDRGDDCYKVFHWDDLTDYEKDTAVYLLRLLQ